MNTSQNYVGRDSHANPEQPNDCQPITSQLVPPDVIQGHYQKLHQTVETMMHTSGSGHLIGLVKNLWVASSLHHVPDEEESTDGLVTVRRDLFDEVYDVMELMTFLAKVGETWRIIKQLEQPSNSTQP